MDAIHLTHEKSVLLNAIRMAGAAVLQLQQTASAETTFKSRADGSIDIVTTADLLANDILKNNLLGAFPDDGWLSEETADDAERLAKKRVWIVDPIDGTREFAAGVPEYAVSVALVEEGIPIISAVFNPATAELFYAIKNGGAWKEDKAIRCTNENPDKLRLLASRSEYHRGEWDKFAKSCHVSQLGSIAYKLALLAAGEAHATFSLGPKSEWDIAAGVLLVQEAGGVVTDIRRETFTFNRQTTRVNGIVATAACVEDDIYSLIDEGNSRV